MHAASRWQVRTSAGSYSSPVYDSGRDTGNLTSITVPSGVLSPGMTYYWHVRYQDNAGAWSDYSAETYFRVQNTPTGTNVTVTQNGATITYSQVTVAGCTIVTDSNTNPVGPLPPNICALLPFYEITTTATSTPPITVALPYNPLAVSNPATLSMYHWTGTAWENCTLWVDTVNHIVYGEVDSLSPFCIGGICGSGELSGGLPGLWSKGLGLLEAFLDYFVAVQYSFSPPEASTGWQWTGEINSLITNKGWAVLDDLVTIIHNALDMLGQFSLMLPASSLSGNSDMGILRIPSP